MDDLEAAKQRLKTENLSLVFFKNSKAIFETEREGLFGFLEAIEKLKADLAEASVADRIIGKAAALLCTYSKVKAAYAVTLSEGGLRVLQKQQILYEYENLVPLILNAKQTDQCPFERLVENVSNPREAYRKIRQALR
jgi:hypothetical protein